MCLVRGEWRRVEEQKRKGICWKHFLPPCPETGYSEWTCRAGERRKQMAFVAQRAAQAEPLGESPKRVCGAGALRQYGLSGRGEGVRLTLSAEWAVDGF